ncbi:MAG: hypothetical protein ACREX9_18505 [Gammaproteobacteria bacterium]
MEVLTVSAYQIALGDDRAALGLVRMRSLAGEAGDASIDSWRRS